MKTSEFNFDLPEELIAQEPLADRASSRLLVANKQTGTIAHRHFYDILEANVFRFAKVSNKEDDAVFKLIREASNDRY